ncbi:hypothetical protein ACROYT_G024698 [Oculina patagonica]
MINDLDVPGIELWKYVDDTTTSETIPKGQASNIQTAVDTFASRASSDKFQLNEAKCKELRISFSTKKTLELDPIVINGRQIDIVEYAKILGVTVSSDLKWNHHIAEVVKKARKRLYCLSQLKRSGLGPNELVQFYRTCIRPITEYACPVFNESLPAYLSRELEAVQKRAMRIIFPFFTYEEALDKASLVTLSGRRQALTDKLFNNILENNDIVSEDMYAVFNTDYSVENNQPKKEGYLMKYRVESNSWQQVSSLLYDEQTAASGACCVALDNYLSIIGGCWRHEDYVSGVTPSESAGRFDTTAKRWEKIANMQHARINVCGAAARGKIFIAGGVIDSGRFFSSRVVASETCEMYNVLTNEWQFIASLNAPRSRASMVCIQGTLYVMGGRHWENGIVPSHASVVESYDFERNEWKPKTKIPTMSKHPNLNWHEIKACTLRGIKKTLWKPITSDLTVSWSPETYKE